LDATSTPSTGVTYNWSTSASTETISTTAAGIYSVVITNAVNGCSVVTQYSITNNSTLPNATAGANAAIPCGGITTTVTLNGNSTNPGVTFSWSGPGIISGSNTATPVVNLAGTYTLTVTNPTTGCVSTSTVDVINAVPTASITPDVTTGFAPLTVNFTNTSTNANTFTWSFGNGTTSTFTTTQNTSSSYNSGGTYTITMIASSGLCSDTASIVIIVDDGFSIEIPNVFTPNDDSVNDVFTITSKGVKEITLQIFNRWGQLMYDFVGPKASWDGVTNAGQKATAGTYFYFIKATGFDGKTINKNGPVSLFR
ncbi:MAG TPA: gliding motility-associated C-terminal domain-containing protein, partial [Bacteroidia bacterium]|nr:gliding motility-associated C-terminal domain-containing protein [Bacteroidia bacterium]